jgi:hypothetical protein
MLEKQIEDNLLNEKLLCVWFLNIYITHVREKDQISYYKQLAVFIIFINSRDITGYWN